MLLRGSLTLFSIGVVCRLRRIQSSRYEIGLQMQGSVAAETTYTSLVSIALSPLLFKFLSNEYYVF